jgi:hypothetical protein
LSRDISRLFERQASLSAAILEQTIRIGYAPDISEASKAIRELLNLAAPNSYIEEIDYRAAIAAQGLEGLESIQGEVPEEGSRIDRVAQYRLGIVDAMLAAGPNVILLPVLRLLLLAQRHVLEDGSPTQDGFFSDTDQSRVKATTRISYRWFKRGSTQLQVRALARAFTLDPSRVVKSLERASRQWRSAEADQSWFHVEGPIGMTDVRIVGSSRGSAELLLRASSGDSALDLVPTLIAALETDAPAVDSIAEVVRTLLTDSSLTENLPLSGFKQERH